MNELQKLAERLRAAHPDGRFTVTRPLRADGVWSLDVDAGDKRLAIEWSPSTHFGVATARADNFGERPDEAFETAEDAQARITQLLTTNEQTSPTFEMPVSWVRERVGVTQRELARRLGVSQATVSGIERRDDIRLSTLHRMIQCLGGSLEIHAGFLQGRFKLRVPAARLADTSRSAAPLRLRRPVTQPSGRIPHNEAFASLSRSGHLLEATKIATAISNRGSVLEMLR